MLRCLLLRAVCRSADRQSPSLSGDEERRSHFPLPYFLVKSEGNKRGLGTRLKPSTGFKLASYVILLWPRSLSFFALYRAGLLQPLDAKVIIRISTLFVKAIWLSFLSNFAFFVPISGFFRPIFRGARVILQNRYSFVKAIWPFTLSNFAVATPLFPSSFWEPFSARKENYTNPGAGCQGNKRNLPSSAFCLLPSVVGFLAPLDNRVYTLLNIAGPRRSTAPKLLLAAVQERATGK
jgi:hypothetical protein